MLLEKGEFIRDKITKQVVWIESISPKREYLEICSMKLEGSIFVKEHKNVRIDDFYNEYEDIRE